MHGNGKDVLHKKKYAHKFDHVFLSTQCSTLIGKNEKEEESFASILAPESLVSVESST